MTALQLVADDVAERLTGVLGASSWLYESTRKAELEKCRELLMHALAESETGVTRAEARLASQYSHSYLTSDVVENADAYHRAVRHHAIRLGRMTIWELLNECRRIERALPVMAEAA